MSQDTPTPSQDAPDEPPRVDALPAFDRVQERAQNDATGSIGSKTIAILLIVAIGVGIGAWLFKPTATETSNLLVRLVDTANVLQPELITTQPEQAHDLVLDQLGWSVPPPEFTALALVGASVSTVGDVKPGEAMPAVPVQIPAFRYEGSGGERAHVFAYDYILLDRIGRAFDLPEATYAVLSEPTPVDSRVVDGNYVVTWRRRAMIFSAVTSEETVAERIRQTVGS